MNKKVLEIIFFAICFLLIFIASIIIYNGDYSNSFVLLAIALVLLFAYIIVKVLKKIL